MIKSHNSISGEQKLWGAILQAAIHDALGIGIRNVCPSARIIVISESRRWFRKGDQDFYTTCAFAGVDADAVREKVLMMVAIADGANSAVNINDIGTIRKGLGPGVAAALSTQIDQKTAQINTNQAVRH